MREIFQDRKSVQRIDKMSGKKANFYLHLSLFVFLFASCVSFSFVNYYLVPYDFISIRLRVVYFCLDRSFLESDFSISNDRSNYMSKPDRFYACVWQRKKQKETRSLNRETTNWLTKVTFASPSQREQKKNRAQM